jgi:hypothetical protein
MTSQSDALNCLSQVTDNRLAAQGAAGNRKAFAELGGRGVSYGYDNDYRLTSADTLSLVLSIRNLCQ